MSRISRRVNSLQDLTDELKDETSEEDLSSHSKSPVINKIKARRYDPSISLKDSEKIIHFVRHAEGEHNINCNMIRVFEQRYFDAKLTNRGIQQCRAFSNEISPNNAHLIVTSPMRRTMTTATLCFPSLVNVIPWIAYESLREQTGLHPCDSRSDLSEYRQQYPHIDFSAIADEKDCMYSLYRTREPSRHVAERSRQFFDWLSHRMEEEVIVVTHNGFLRSTFHNVLDITDVKHHEGHFGNCTMKSYVVELDDPTKKYTSSI